MSKEVAKKVDATEGLRKLLTKGDLGKLSENHQAEYLLELCKSLGLNPQTAPIQLIEFRGGVTKPYATKDCTEQLRSLHGVSVVKLETKNMGAVYSVTATVTDKHGRTDVATGVVTVEGMKGDNLCNQLMKAETKAKRRATLSICGLGFLDESEIETVPDAKVVAVSMDANDSAPAPDKKQQILNGIKAHLLEACANKQERGAMIENVFGFTKWKEVEALDEVHLQAGYQAMLRGRDMNQGGVQEAVTNG